MQLEWNFISSRACDWVGSATPRNRRLPRWNSGSALCLVISSSLTSFSGIGFGFSVVASISGMPNSIEATRVTSPPSIRCLSNSQLVSETFCWLESSTALRTSASGRTFSTTNRRAMPDRPTTDGCA